MHISKVSKSFNEEVSFLFNDDILLRLTFQIRKKKYTINVLVIVN